MTSSHQWLAARVSLGKVKLVGDVDKNGGAARRNAAAGKFTRQGLGAGKIGEVERFEEFANSGRGAREAAGATAR
jgi:hypothetical protein